MRSKQLSTTNLNWDSPISLLFQSKRLPKFIENFNKAGLQSLFDLIKVFPLRIYKTPPRLNFKNISLNEYFQGEGVIIYKDFRPAFGRKFKGKLLLYQGHVVVKDLLSEETLNLRWFNVYPNQKKQIEQLEVIQFLGLPQIFNGQKQIVNPQILNSETKLSDYIIEYPTINKVSGIFFKKLIDSIPNELWNSIPSDFNFPLMHQKLTIQEAYKILHGKTPPQFFNSSLKNLAEERLIYEQFIEDRLKILTRKKYIKSKSAPVFNIDKNDLNSFLSKLPFNLTIDQEKVLDEIKIDFSSGKSMMRMIQGDVGCGKTVVSFLAAMISIKNNYQVAIMCPTEALAKQHAESFKSLAPNLNIQLLLGSTKTKEKKQIQEDLKNGVIHIIIGTHSLFQDSVTFKNLGLAIIDEQHKFGVEQRLKLVSKGKGTHCLIMSATPIPRTLSLIQYGDLDISIIKSMPEGRVPIKTRITEQINYEKYIQFIKMRLNLGEQAYFVFPAIDENEMIDIENVKTNFEKYKNIFSQFRIDVLHGQMKPDEKNLVIEKFKNNESQILLSTSVIEVGINIPNTTIMSIYNPERFGLSSLHQLRGRVGRGHKPGFCFLVTQKELGQQAMERLKVIEKTLDGFHIAEEDLKFRGEGDLFGVDQSGNSHLKKLGNFITHQALYHSVIDEINKLTISNNVLINQTLEKLAKDQKILDTI